MLSRSAHVSSAQPHQPQPDTAISVLIYGATGYTGRLIAQTASDYGIRPILAGRSAAPLQAMARELSLEHRVFALDQRIDLAGVSVVLHCAGPFTHTSSPMAGACIEQRVHYVDITGEIEVLEQLHERDAQARAAGIMLLPGAGFDVVPSDCLAAHLAQRLPGATHLTLGISGTGRLSHGTAATMVEHAHRGGMIRRNGKLVHVRAGWKTRDIDFGEGPKKAVTIPWGDIATSYYSTGIPNVEVYSVLPPRVRPVLLLSRYLRWLLRSRWLKRRVQQRIRSGPAGPGQDELRRGRSLVWAEVVDDAGNFIEARYCGPNGYMLTAHSTLLVLKRVLAGSAPVGFQTPSLAYGADFALEIPGSERY